MLVLLASLGSLWIASRPPDASSTYNPMSCESLGTEYRL